MNVLFHNKTMDLISTSTLDNMIIFSLRQRSYIKFQEDKEKKRQKKRENKCFVVQTQTYILRQIYWLCTNDVRTHFYWTVLCWISQNKFHYKTSIFIKNFQKTCGAFVPLLLTSGNRKPRSWTNLIHCVCDRS